MIKNYIISFIIVFKSLVLFSAEDIQALFDSANVYYSEGKYEQAIDNYERIINNDYESSELYYNLGSAYFKNNMLPEAILFYEKAKLLNPDDEDIQYNLELAYSRTTDDIEELPNFFLNEWINSVKNVFTVNGWAYIGIFTFALSLILIALFLFSRRILIRKLCFWFGILLFIISVLSVTFSYNLKEKITNHEYAIIFSPTLTVKSSPDKSGTDLFVLHEGTKVHIQETLGKWINVKIADGNEGWIKAEDVRLI